VVHAPAAALQHHPDPAVAEARVASRQAVQVRHEPWLVVGDLSPATLR